ncbi:unnamed protein product [Trichobilharzia szidati]|nr:unnamed protein product [Trichobilharzia szidati]
MEADKLEYENLRIIHRQAYRSSPDAVRPQHNSDSKSFLPNSSFDKPSPQINFKPKHSFNFSPVTDSYGSHLGAVARLAIDGGLTTDQLLQIGSSDVNQPGHYLYRSATHCDQKEVVPDSKYNLSDPRITKLLTSHSSLHSRPCRISPRGTRRPVFYSSNQSVQIIRGSGVTAAYDQSRVTVSPSHTSVGHHRLSQWSASRDNPHYISGSNRVSFPAQMTRVGGLVFSTGSSNPGSDNADMSPVEQNVSSTKPYQSVSACTSPTNLKHTVSSHSPSTSFFSCSNVPSPSETPPLVSTNVTDNVGTTDIVRLGPGNVVTRTPAGSTVYSPSSLIRMHYCPQPYVGMGLTGAPYVPVVSTLTISNLNVPSPVLSDGSDSCLCSKPTINSEPNISTAYSDLGTTSTPEPVFPCSTSSPSPTEMSPTIINRPGSKRNYVDPTLRSSAPVPSTTQYLPTVGNSITDTPNLPHPKPFNSHNSPSSQVARTVRHLRRIRHIFGDSFGYTSSATSASTGALTDEDKDSVCSPKVSQLRSHGYHSVDSVRGSSSLCDCSPDRITDSNDKKSNKTSYSHTSSYPVIASVYWNDSETEVTKKSLLWYNYQVTLSGQTLVLTREKSPSQVYPNDSLDHVHIPLPGESIVWHVLNELPDLVCPSSPSHCDRETGIVGILNSSKLNLTCYLHFPNRQIASCIFDHLGPQKTMEDCQGKQPVTQTSHGLLSKLSTGRSSLGLAGPSGVTPLFKAMGTAAASVGMQLADYVNFPGMSQSVSVPSQSSPSTGNGDISKLKGEQTSKAKPSDTPESTTPQPSKSRDLKFLPSFPRGRGRLQQALTRMRRAATASCDPTSRSGANVTTRRFASSHNYGKNKPGLISLPFQTSIEPVSPSSELDSSCSNITSQPSDLSPLTLLLATSVSPSPSLQTSCLTYMQVEPKESINANVDSSEESPNYIHKEISQHHPNTTDTTISSQQSKLDFKTTDQLTVIVSENSVQDASVSEGNADKSRRKLANSMKSKHHFVPLPIHIRGPLPLHKCPRSTLSPFVPFVVELCVTLVERYGLNCIGIYRLSGSKVAHDFITSELSRDITTVDVTSDKWNDLHAVCGVLKTFLRNLPDSLFPKVMYPDFLAACRLPQREKRLLSIQRLLSIMECYPCHPEYRAHRATLRYLATHLARVSAREAVNKMTAYNLALVFAPNLVQPCEDTPELLMSDSKYKIMLVETVIKYHAWIFSPDLGLESGCSVPPDSTEDLTPEIDVGSRAICDTSASDADDSAHQPGRIEGDVQPLVAELLNAAASLPPPPSDTDLETAEIPGPESDRPSDIIMSRPRFTSIPATNWSTSTTSISRIPSGGLLNEMSTTTDHLSALKINTEHIEIHNVTTVDGNRKDSEVGLGRVATSGNLRPLHTPSDLGIKLDNLRHLSQGCLEQFTSEARKLGVRVAESRRQLESTVAQRLHAEQLLFEARSGECSDLSKSQIDSSSTELLNQPEENPIISSNTSTTIQSAAVVMSTDSVKEEKNSSECDDKNSNNCFKNSIGDSSCFRALGTKPP